MEPSEAHLQPPHRDPPRYSTVHVCLPPPYKVQQHSYSQADQRHFCSFLLVKGDDKGWNQCVIKALLSLVQLEPPAYQEPSYADPPAYTQQP